MSKRIGKMGVRLPLWLTLLLTFALTVQACEAGGNDQKRKPKRKRKSVTVVKKVRYSEEKNLFFDFYAPKFRRTEKLPLVIFIHGGGWRSGNRKRGKKLCTRLARSGFAAVSIDYTLSPQAPFPAACKDVKTAIRYFRANADKWGIDPERIGLIGNSAGAHLAAFAATNDDPRYEQGEDWPGVSSRVQAVVAQFGPYDYLAQKAGELVQTFLGGSPDQKPEVYREASPITHVSADDPPLLLIHGEKDRVVPIEHAERMYRAYQNAGAPVEFIRVKNAGHALKKRGWFGKVQPSRKEIEKRILQFLQTYLWQDNQVKDDPK
ncbi:MAG: alpha/beta hydrolase [candidate division KSB1 bacterium]|nr:alpha/beta hydrolase [candidate division KSB1 bacterium]